MSFKPTQQHGDPMQTISARNVGWSVKKKVLGMVEKYLPSVRGMSRLLSSRGMLLIVATGLARVSGRRSRCVRLRKVCRPCWSVFNFNATTGPDGHTASPVFIHLFL